MDLLALCDGEISVLRRDKAANLKGRQQRQQQQQQQEGEQREEKDSAKDSNSNKHPEFSSPLSFMEAWDSSFFFAPALLLLTTLGFVVKSVPTLDKLPLGDRLRLC